MADQENKQPAEMAQMPPTAKSKKHTGTLAKAQATALRAVLESTAGNMELRSTKLRELYIQEAQKDAKRLQAIANLEKKLEMKDTEAKSLLSQKSTLEKLCRELRKQVKASTELNRQQTALEQNKRKELSEHFSTSFDDLATKMKEEEVNRLKQQEDNAKLHETLNQYLKHTETQQETFEKQLEAKGIEIKLVEAKAAQREGILSAKIAELESYVSQQNRSIELYKEQVRVYKERSESTEATFTKSTELITALQAQSKQTTEQIKLMGSKQRELEKKHSATLILYHKGIEDAKMLKDELQAKERTIHQCKQLNSKLLEKLKLSSTTQENDVEVPSETPQKQNDVEVPSETPQKQNDVEVPSETPQKQNDVEVPSENSSKAE